MESSYLVVGSTGLMGTTFLDKVPQSIGVNEETLDITSRESVDDYFNKNANKFDVVVNFAAYTNVDGAEKERGDEKGLVWKLNVDGPKNLAEACKKYDKFLIHISTDFIFEGTKENPGPYSEDSETPKKLDKMGWYGWTKLQGENSIQSVGGNWAITRTAYPFRIKTYDLKKDYAHGILSLYEENKLYPMFTDQKITPVLIEDLVEAIEKVAQIKKQGIYHVVANDVVSPYEFTSHLLERYAGKKIEIQKGLMEEFMKTPGRTPRPLLGGLKSEKTQRELGIKFRSWKDVIDKFVEGVKNQG